MAVAAAEQVAAAAAAAAPVAATEPVVTRLAAIVAGSRGHTRSNRGHRGRHRARHFTRHLATDHTGAGDHLLARHAHAHGAGLLARHHPGPADVLLHHTSLRDAAGEADLLARRTVLGAVGRDLAHLGPHLADLAAAGHRALLLHHVRAPHLALHAVVHRG